MCARNWGDENRGVDDAKLRDEEYRAAWRGLRNLHGIAVFAVGGTSVELGMSALPFIGRKEDVPPKAPT